MQSQIVNLRAPDCAMAIVSAGRCRINLHLSNVFAELTLRVDHRDYPTAKRSFRVSFYGRANEYETLSVNVRIRMMSRSRTQKKRNPSLNQSQSRTVNQTMRWENRTRVVNSSTQR